VAGSDLSEDGGSPVIIDCRGDPTGAIEAAVSELESGRVVAMATDTVYGLVARADDAEAIFRIYELKDRPPERRMAVLVADVAQAAELVELDGLAWCLASSFWPGPLTIAAPRRRSATTLAGDRSSIGVRCPAHDVVRTIAERVGPLAATSANRHGRPPETDAESVAASFPTVALVLDGGELPGAASSVVSVSGGELSVVREGPIGEDRLRRECGGSPGDPRNTE
jgi:L-threonylcarbamoyladenylate synthase